MKILIAYASAGAGHLKAAEALYAYIEENFPDVSARMVDVVDESSRFLGFLYRSGYSVLVKYAPWLWAIGFWVTQNRLLRGIIRPLSDLISRMNTKQFARGLLKENPDIIISTHFLTSEIAAQLKRSGRINSKLVTVITDFGVHPFWLSKGTDIYIAASVFTKELLVKEGVVSDRILDFGIPVKKKFIMPFDRISLAEKLEIHPDRFTLLVMTGSFGIGPIEEVVQMLSGKVQILVVCANNQGLFKRLSLRHDEGLKIFGFIDNVHELMAVSDLIVTKPGGLSIVELLAMELAPVFVSAIPGQECCNALFLEDAGIGRIARSAHEIAGIVLDYKMHPEKLSAIKAKIQEIRKPYAAKELIDALCSSRL